MKWKIVTIRGLFGGLLICSGFLAFVAASPIQATPDESNYCSRCHDPDPGTSISVEVVNSTETFISYNVSGSDNYGDDEGWGVYNPGGNNIANGYFEGAFNLPRDGQTYRVFWVDNKYAYMDITPPLIWYRDADGDGYGNPNDSVQSPTQPPEYVSDNTDCNDSDSTINPGATEVCDGKDNDCDGQTDEGGVCNLWYRDADGDGYGNPNDSVQSPTQPPEYVSDNTDCNDSDSSINPGATEVCDGKDNDCDGQTDEGGVCNVWYRDADGDGYGNPNDSVQSPTQPPEYVSDNTDCNDGDSSINPGATEVCGDYKDNDCDGQIDETCISFDYHFEVARLKYVNDDDPLDMRFVEVVVMATGAKRIQSAGIQRPDQAWISLEIEPDGNEGYYEDACDITDIESNWTDGEYVIEVTFTDSSIETMPFTKEPGQYPPFPNVLQPEDEGDVNTTTPLIEWSGEIDYLEIYDEYWDEVFLAESEEVAGKTSYPVPSGVLEENKSYILAVNYNNRPEYQGSFTLVRFQTPAIISHVSDIELWVGWDYKEPNEPNDLTYNFYLGLETDGTVNLIGVNTPAGYTFTIPNDVNTQSGNVETWHYVEEGTHYWGYEAEFNDVAELDSYGDGPYIVTVYHEGGGQAETTVSFGDPNTGDPIPQPMQEPNLTFPPHNGAAPSPVTFTWQPCTDANATSIRLYLEEADANDEIGIDLHVDDTNSGPIVLGEGMWEAVIGFEHWYDYNNADGIHFEIGKYSESTYRFTVTSLSPVGHWEFDDCSDPGKDSSGYNNDATLIGEPECTGCAMQFDGIDDYLDVPDDPSLDMTTKLTVALWMQQPVLATDKALAAKWDYKTQGCWALQTDNSDSDELRVFTATSLSDNGSGGNAKTANANMVAGNWYHVAFVYDGDGATNADRLKVYVDGVEKTLSFAGSIPSFLQNSSASVKIGEFGGVLHRYFNGVMDDVRIYNRALSTQEVGGLASISPCYPPVANAGPDQTVEDTNENGFEWIDLDGSQSTHPDPNRAIVSYFWTSPRV
jgi:hypothetical protein